MTTSQANHSHFTRAAAKSQIFDENATVGRAKRGKKALTRKALGTIPVNRQRQEGGKKDVSGSDRYRVVLLSSFHPCLVVCVMRRA